MVNNKSKYIESVLDKSTVTWLVMLWYFIHLIGQI